MFTGISSSVGNKDKRIKREENDDVKIKVRQVKKFATELSDPNRDYKKFDYKKRAQVTQLASFNKSFNKINIKGTIHCSRC